MSNSKESFRNLGFLIADRLVKCPLFSLPVQIVCLAIALLIPIFWGDVRSFSNFLLVYMFSALSFLSVVLSFFFQKTRNTNYENCKPAWFAQYMQKSAAYPEVDRSILGMIVVVFFVIELINQITVWAVLSVLCILMISLVEYYLLFADKEFK